MHTSTRLLEAAALWVLAEHPGARSASTQGYAPLEKAG